MSGYRCTRCNTDFDEGHDYLAHDEWCSKKNAPPISRDEIALRLFVTKFQDNDFIMFNAEYGVDCLNTDKATLQIRHCFEIADLFIEAGKEGK